MAAARPTPNSMRNVELSTGFHSYPTDPDPAAQVVASEEGEAVSKETLDP